MAQRRRVQAGVLAVFGAFIVYTAGPVFGDELGLSLQGRLTLRGGPDSGFDLNTMNRGDNPFSSFRVLVLTQAAVNDNTDLFLEIPIDSNARSSLFLTYLRPFIRISSLGDRPWLNVQAGKLPTLFGTYGERTASTEPGLMAVPLLYYYHTAVQGNNAPAGPGDFFLPGVRGEQTGTPIVYDACWDIGAEVFGTHNGFQFTAAATQGTVSRPSMGENYNDGYQFLSRVGYEVTSGPLFGLRFGATGAFGPYLSSSIAEDADFPAGKSPEDYLNTALGLDLAYARGPWRFFGEAGRIGYEVPNVDPTLNVTAYYLEVIRNLGPSWAVAVRQEAALFSDLTAGAETGPWDYDVWRWEATVNYRFRRGTRIRVGYQDARYPDAPEYDTNLFAVQLQVWTR
jgi:hypothetical protein